MMDVDFNCHRTVELNGLVKTSRTMSHTRGDEPHNFRIRNNYIKNQEETLKYKMTSNTDNILNWKDEDPD